ncbi:WD40 repeat domain-containing protein [Nocardioides allogilvus]|uniref:hypothetical protein n=1 Tax=Nocardioides allogilvus TaxID=2072017 RepID=UPI000D30C9F6|nr:hypothetical protein [Nocardioides allogilvus]
MTTLRTFALAATTAALCSTALLVPATASAPVELQPEDLSRGSDIAVAHIEDGDLVVGDRRVDVGGERAYLIGKAGRGHLVGTSDSDGGSLRIVRVKLDNTVTVIKRGVPFFEAKVSHNGRFFALAGRGTRRAVPVRVFSARSGKLKVEKDFPNYPTVLGMAGTRVLLTTWGGSSKGVRWWDTGNGAVTAVTRRPAGQVDIGNNLLASYTKDPYRDGCTIVSRLSDPTVRLWKSCTERVEDFSPDGERIATVHILSDGIGPSEVWEREVDGSLLGEYSTNWFGRIGFEDATDLLLEVNGDTRSSTVRCSEGDCENATDPVAVQQPRPGFSRALPSRRFGSSAPAAGAWQTPQF